MSYHYYPYSLYIYSIKHVYEIHVFSCCFLFSLCYSSFRWCSKHLSGVPAFERKQDNSHKMGDKDGNKTGAYSIEFKPVDIDTIV